MPHPRHLAAVLSAFAMIGVIVALCAASVASAQPATTGQGLRVATARRAASEKSPLKHKAHRKARKSAATERRPRKAGRRSVGQAYAVNPASVSSSSFFKATRLSDFWVSHSAPGAITEVQDPAGSGESVFQMTVNDKDVYPITPTENPRANCSRPRPSNPR